MVSSVLLAAMALSVLCKACRGTLFAVGVRKAGEPPALQRCRPQLFVQSGRSWPFVRSRRLLRCLVICSW